MAHSSSGLGHRPLKAEITGSNPVCATNAPSLPFFKAKWGLGTADKRGLTLKIIFDSSALIAAFIESHPKHKSALSFLSRANNRECELFVSAHTILEVYSVLTSAPFRPKITSAIAKQLIENNIKAFAKIIYLSDKDYFKIIEKMCSSGLIG